MNYLQNTKIDSAIIFSFNILRSVYSNFGVSHFIPVHQVLEQEHDKTALLPIINYEESSIEKRAERISKSLPEV